MDHLYLWRYSHPAGGRVVTLDRFTDAEALRLFHDPERVEGSEMVAEPRPHRGWGFASGLVRRDDGAMLPPPTAGGSPTLLSVRVLRRARVHPSGARGDELPLQENWSPLPSS